MRTFEKAERKKNGVKAGEMAKVVRRYGLRVDVFNIEKSMMMNDGVANGIVK